MWPTRTCSQEPVSIFHTRKVASRDPLTTLKAHKSNVVGEDGVAINLWYSKPQN